MKKYYCLGIKGAGMSTLAQILNDLGNNVSGYDDVKDYKFTEKGLVDRNISIYYDNSLELDKDLIVTHSRALPDNHPEIVRAKEAGLVIKKYNEIISEVIDMFDTIGVSGTHGKTTTSSIVKHVLESTIGCNYFIGAGDGKASNDNKYFVVESDEFNKHFSIYKPKYSIITNIEEEHMECYKDIDDIRNTFETFANQTKELVVAYGDNLEVKKMNFKTNKILYGFNNDNDVVIKNLKLNTNGSNFDLYEDNEFIGNYDVPLYGEHMVLNTTSAIILLRRLGLSNEVISDKLLTFKNAARRFVETFVDDAVIIDDYAHHPTEIKATLLAAKQKYPNKKIVAVFKPNTYSRTVDFLDDFIEVFKLADKTFLTEIDSNREKQEDYPGVNSSLIVDKVDEAELIDVSTIDKLSSYKDSVVVFMSCAYVDKLIDAYKDILDKVLV